MKPLIVLKLPKSTTSLSLFAHSVVGAMTDEPWFPDPSPSLDAVTATVRDLDAAEAARLTRRKGTKETRNEKATAVRTDLRHLAAYVQAVADQNPAHAEVIIAAAGMTPKRPSIRNKQPLAASDGATSGTVVLRAKALGDRIAYGWYLSLDGETWTFIRQTMQASTVVTGLTPGRVYFFQLRPVTIHGPGKATDVVSLLVR
jgi:hypothetical protein